MPVRKRRKSADNQHLLKVHFMGAAQSVTGSLHFFEYTNEGKTVRLFADSGLDQQNPGRNRQNRLPVGVKPSDVDFGFFTHAHLDHIGLFPLLAKSGFRGPVYATGPTVDIAGISLPDSGYLQEEEAERLNRRKRGRPRTEPVQPLYTQEDAQKCLSLMRKVDFGQVIQPAENIAATFTSVSHILGAGALSLNFGKGSKKRTVVFTGDLGRSGMPILPAPETIKHADYVICEATYGSRCHLKRDRLQALADEVNAFYKRAMQPHEKYGYGVMLAVAFTIDRGQAFIADLRKLMAEKRIPEIPVFLDSPMGIRVTDVYRKYPHLYNAESAALAAKGVDPFRTPRYAELSDYASAQRLLEPASQPIIIVSSSGMATGGRVVQHLTHRLPGAQHTVLFLGYQAEGTLGRQLLEPGLKSVKIGQNVVSVAATVNHFTDYSGHADADDIIRWLSRFQTKPKTIFLVHGDPENLEALKAKIEKQLRWNVVIPKLKESFILE